MFLIETNRFLAVEGIRERAYTIVCSLFGNEHQRGNNGDVVPVKSARTAGWLVSVVTWQGLAGCRATVQSQSPTEGPPAWIPPIIFIMSVNMGEYAMPKTPPLCTFWLISLDESKIRPPRGEIRMMSYRSLALYHYS